MQQDQSVIFVASQDEKDKTICGATMWNYQIE